MPFVAREPEVVERQDAYQLLCVLVQKCLLVIHWYDNCAVWCPCELCGIHTGGCVDNGGKVSRSSNFCALVSVNES